jgi:malate dehydrogenase (oxaloacetate-decarboxylating)(NADP+)
MEGKAVLFKRFADIDVFDLEIDAIERDEFIQVVKHLAPTFGGINLEDIRSPDCFYIEEQLKQQMNIPVFHDDQHGTAIITGAGLINALRLVNKNIDEIRVVFAGAGAAGIACARYYLELGVRKENLIVCDSNGVIYEGRKTGMNPWKEKLASSTSYRKLEDAMNGADVFVGLSKGRIVSQEMIRSMAKDPIVFALANPEPEISPEEAIAARPDVIIATGRSDYPNQINNVMGFPFIFRGALDVRARVINEEMKLAATKAIAELAREPVPYTVMKAYGTERIDFGRDYIVPRPFDPRLLLCVAPMVAKAAMESDVAQLKIDLDQYKENLEARLGLGRKVMRVVINKAKKEPKRIVYPEGHHVAILKASEIIVDEGIAQPILLGNRDFIEATLDNLHLKLKGIEIVDPAKSRKLEEYSDAFYAQRQRKGISREEANELMKSPNYFGCMMVNLEDADGIVSGLTQSYPETIRPALQIIGMRSDVNRVAGLHLLLTREAGMYFFADTTVNVSPTAEELAEIAIACAREVRRFDVEPRIAMLSFSNFGTARNSFSDKVRHATEIVKKRAPYLIIDGEMQAEVALVPEIIQRLYPFSPLSKDGGVNVLIFPDLEAANIAFQLLNRLGKVETIGPILVGMRKPVHLLQPGDFDEMDVVNMTALAVVDAQIAHPLILL